MSLSEISNILWRERRLLELLAFKLEEERLVLASGQTRWLSRASGEVDTIIEEMKHVRLERAIGLADLTAELGLSDAPTLRELAAVAPPPWDGICSQHGRALQTLAREIASMARSDRTPTAPRVANATSAAHGEIDIVDNERAGLVPDRSPVLRLVDDEI
jgi:hypothetical protein